MTDKNLEAFPVHVIHPDRVLYRIHSVVHDPLHFSNSGDGRFDLVALTDAGTCYLSTSEKGAFVEKFGRFKYLTQRMLDERALASVSLTRPLNLADLTDRTVLGNFGIAGDLSAGADYTDSQGWAARLSDAGFDGIFYAARHDPSFTERSVAVFGNDETGSKLFEVVSEPIPQELVDEACDEFAFTVWPTTPLL